MNFKSTYRCRQCIGRIAAPDDSTNMVRTLAAALLLLWNAAGGAGQVAAAEPVRRIVSINLCTDQLLLALAAPNQIAGLSRFSRNTEMSFLASRAAAYPSLRGTAEEVLKLAPSLVLAGAFSGRATRLVLEAQAVRLETFAPPRSIAEARAEIVRVAELVGQVPKGHALVDEIDTAVAEAGSAARARATMSVLAIQRRGFASGRETLVSSALEAAGLRNAADALGITSVGRAPLETILRLKPDFLVLEDLAIARDQSSAVLHHPALVHAYPPARLIVLPVAELTCGGSSLPVLLRRLTKTLGRG